MKMVVVYKQTSEDWPSYKLVNIKVLCIKFYYVKNNASQISWVIVVLGSDMTGYEKEFYDKEIANNYFNAVINLNDVTKQSLLNLNFKELPR